MANPAMLQTGEFEFTREDAIKLCASWQHYVWNRQMGSWQGDNVETLIEELCLAWGFTVDEIRATWRSPGSERFRKPATEQTS